MSNHSVIVKEIPDIYHTWKNKRAKVGDTITFKKADDLDNEQVFRIVRHEEIVEEDKEIVGKYRIKYISYLEK